MKDSNFKNSALRTIQVEAASVHALTEQLDVNFERLCEAILLNTGKLILMGVGKSGHIAQKISATLSSTGTPSFFIHPTEAAHGDLGMISKHDAVMIFSNSGETKEIISILPALKRCTNNIFTLTNNYKSTIGRIGKINIVIKAEVEACPLDLAPTSSTTIALVFGDALAIALLEHKGFTKNDFAKSHPSGQLGMRLTTLVSDLATSGSNVPLVNTETSLKDALMEITEKKLGITLVSDRKVIAGIFTDGDLRRCLNNQVSIDSTQIKDVMTTNYKTIEGSCLAMEAAQLMEENKISSLVVSSNKGQNDTGIITMYQLLAAGII